MKRVFEENFITELSGGWDLVHEEPTAWKIENDRLYLRTLPGTLWGKTNNAHNFLLRSIGQLFN